MFDFQKPLSRLVGELGVVFFFLMEADVNFLQGLYSALVDGFLVAPKVVRNDKLAKLRAPVAQVVDTYDVVSQRLVGFVKGATYCGSAEVTDMEGFCDIYTAVIYADRFSFA